MRKPWFLMLAALLPLVVGSTALSDRDDHDVARDAFERSGTMPLAEILDVVGRKIGGEIVGVELEREYGRYVYEFKVVTPKGRLLEIYVDAMTAEILKIEDD